MAIVVDGSASMTLVVDGVPNFDRAVRQFFSEVNAPNETDWQTALAEARRLNAAEPDLPSIKAETKPPRVEVVLLDGAKVTPSANELVQIAEAA